MAKKEPNLNDPKEQTKYWTEYAAKHLVGRRITKVAYLTSKECKDDFGWYKRPITFTLDDGKLVIAQMDDEGNDGGVLSVEHPPHIQKKSAVLPVL